MRVNVLVIGGGQAGLSAAFHCARTGLSYRAVDAESAPGGAWQHRWPTLTMRTVNGIRELPDSVVPPVPDDLPARVAVPAYFADYEREHDLGVERPMRVTRVEPAGADLVAYTDDGRQIVAQTLINATGTWTKPFWPHYPGQHRFAGRQLHTHDYTGPESFAGQRVVVVGGGISALQLLLEIAPVVADHRWVTRRDPEWTHDDFTHEFGARAVAKVERRVRLGLPPQSVVTVTGLPLTPQTRAARDSGILDRRPMFSSIDHDGVVWSDGTRFDADILFWCTGFRAALDHLAPLRLRAHGGGIAMDGTRTVIDPRVHLIGYGPSASTIGANRAGRAATRQLAQMLRVNTA